jgi:flagellar hook assembly protein FlgD
VLNGYFENDFDNYTRGSLIYDLGYMSIGNHSVTVKAWDNFNNSSEATISFKVEPDDKFLLKNLINYPNPFLGETRITAEHNRPDNEFDVTVNIFSLDGRIIKIIKTIVSSSGFVLPPVVWDGTVEGGKRAGKGVYPYSVTIKTDNSETAVTYGRMIIL